MASQEPNATCAIVRSMTMFRFCTPHRTGKWYPDLETAQRQAYAIGAGFRDPRNGEFVQYPGTRLETQVVDDDDTGAPRGIAA